MSKSMKMIGKSKKLMEKRKKRAHIWLGTRKFTKSFTQVSGIRRPSENSRELQRGGGTMMYKLLELAETLVRRKLTDFIFCYVATVEDKFATKIKKDLFLLQSHTINCYMVDQLSQTSEHQFATVGGVDPTTSWDTRTLQFCRNSHNFPSHYHNILGCKTNQCSHNTPFLKLVRKRGLN